MKQGVGVVFVFKASLPLHIFVPFDQRAKTTVAMYLYFIALYIFVAYATATVLLYECGTLDVPSATYKLAQDIHVNNSDFGYVCFDIKGGYVTLDGNGFELSSNKLIPAIGIQYTAERVTVKNMRITNLRTGIRASGKFGEVLNNTITRGVNGIDVCATNNQISGNFIGNFDADEATAGIYVYFPALAPVDSSINITNNVISDIRGDSFAMGISVYYATSVFIANNHIYNLWGGVLKEEISVMHGKMYALDNSFEAPILSGNLSTPELLVSLVALLATFIVSRSGSGAQPKEMKKKDEVKEEEEKEEEEEKSEKEKKKEEEEEFEMDGADVIGPLSFSVGTSPVGLG